MGFSINDPQKIRRYRSKIVGKEGAPKSLKIIKNHLGAIFILRKGKGVGGWYS